MEKTKNDRKINEVTRENSKTITLYQNDIVGMLSMQYVAQLAYQLKGYVIDQYHKHRLFCTPELQYGKEEMFSNMQKHENNE